MSYIKQDIGARAYRFVVNPRRPQGFWLKLAALAAGLMGLYGAWGQQLPLLFAPIAAMLALAAAYAALHALGPDAGQRREFVISERGLDERRRRIELLPRVSFREIHLPGETIARLHARNIVSGHHWHIGQASIPGAGSRSLRARRAWRVEAEARGESYVLAGGLDFDTARSLLFDVSRALGSPQSRHHN